MGISLNNYEQYFLDHLEGNLSPEMEKELAEFLLAHPELREILEEYDAVTIPVDESITFHLKNSLKKNIHSFSHSDNKKLEDMMVSSVEGLLSAEEESGLQQLLISDPAKVREMEAFRKTRVSADLSVIYPYKSKLKRRTGIAYFPRLVWGIASAAALIIILLGIQFISKVEVNQVRPPAQAASEIPAATHEEIANMPPAITQTEIAVVPPKTLAAVPVVSQKVPEMPERSMSFRMTDSREALYISSTKEYNVRRLKKRPYPQLRTVEIREQSLLAELAERVFNKTGQEIKETLRINEVRKPRLNFWAVVSTGIKGYNKITDRELELYVNKNDEGRVSSYALIEHDRMILNRELITQ